MRSGVATSVITLALAAVAAGHATPSEAAMLPPCAIAPAAGPSGLDPFADDSGSLGIGGLTVENGTDRVAVYGSLDLTRDKAGLEHAREVHALLGCIVETLEAAGPLPDKVPPPDEPEVAANPFR